MTCRVVPSLKCTERARLAVSKAVNLKTNFMVKLEAFRENVPAEDFYSHPNDFHYKIAMSYSNCNALPMVFGWAFATVLFQVCP